jgi:hypothetical protein
MRRFHSFKVSKFSGLCIYHTRRNRLAGHKADSNLADGLESERPRRGLLDGLGLLGSSLLVVILGIGSFFLADRYHVDLIWPILGWISLGFFAALGWDYRREFRTAAFTSFFLSWVLLHSLVFVLVLGYLSWIYYIVAVPLELFAFYASASLLFGLKPPGRR